MPTFTQYISSLELTCLSLEQELDVASCDECPLRERCEFSEEMEGAKDGRT